jgi:hypothetical protein
VDFWGVWSGSRLICNYFLGIEVPAIKFANAQGPRRNIQQVQGARCKIHGIYRISEFFSNGKSHGSSPWWYGQAARLGSMLDQRVGANRRALRCGCALIGIGPPNTLGHRSSLARAEKREGSTGVLLQASPKLRWWCGDWAMAMKQQRWRSSAVVALKLGGRGKRGEEGAVRNGGGHLLL